MNVSRVDPILKFLGDFLLMRNLLCVFFVLFFVGFAASNILIASELPDFTELVEANSKAVVNIRRSEKNRIVEAQIGKTVMIGWRNSSDSSDHRVLLNALRIRKQDR